MEWDPLRGHMPIAKGLGHPDPLTTRLSHTPVGQRLITNYALRNQIDARVSKIISLARCFPLPA